MVYTQVRCCVNVTRILRPKMDKDMSEIKIPKILLSQVEDALEERENNDRRKKEKGIPTGLQAERRKQDRRAAKNQG